MQWFLGLGFFDIFVIYWIYRIVFFWSINFWIYLGVQLSRSGGILFFFFFLFFFRLSLSVVDYLVCNTVYVAWG